MNLDTYFNSRPIGTRADLARKLRIAPTYLYQLEKGIRKISLERCIEIEKATEGAVRCEDMRPDIEWSVLRKSGTE